MKIEIEINKDTVEQIMNQFDDNESYSVVYQKIENVLNDSFDVRIDGRLVSS